jgi:endonuclease-3 related protein
VGAFLTQNTAWANVEKAMTSLRSQKLLSPQGLSAISEVRLAKLIRSSGYFRQKAGRLRNFYRFIMGTWKGRLDRFLERPVSLVRRELLALHGVGPETADSILLYAGHHPVFVVDAYTRRFGRRFGLFSTDDYEVIQSFFAASLAPAVRVYREFHALLVALGKEFCRSRPRCEPCPLRTRCKTGRS